MRIYESTLKKLSFLYIIIPLILFLLGWLKIYISIPIILVTLYLTYKYFKDNKNDNYFKINKKCIVFIILISLFWCFIAGIGKLFYQPTFWDDYIARNSIYNDLTTKNWPVSYEDGTHLSYYFGQWLVPASITKLTSLFIKNDLLLKSCKNIYLLYWCTFGIVLLFLWIINYFKIKKSKTIFLVILSFILFSGLDIIGQLIINKTLTFRIFLEGLEYWASYFYQYSNFNSLLFWVYNQMIVPIIITFMCLSEKSYKYRGVLLISGLLFGPFLILGLGIYLITYDIIISIKNKSLKYLKRYFTIPNILALIFIFPILFLFYKSNITVQQSKLHLFRGFILKNYILFIIFEFLIYLFLIFKRKNKNNISLFIITFYLIIIPLYGELDFVMRVSIPFLIILWINIIKFILNKTSNKIKKYILIILLLIASINPIGEIYRGFYMTYKQGYIGSNLIDVEMNKFNDYHKVHFLSDENNIFYNFLAK